MPHIWSYSDNALRGYGIFKRQLFMALEAEGWKVSLAIAPLLDPETKSYLRKHFFESECDWILLINQTASQFYDYLEIPIHQRPLPQNKIVWFLDDPSFFIDCPFESNEFVFSFDETYLKVLKEYHASQYGILPLAADMEIEGQYNKKWACDVCFVGGVIDQSEKRNQLSPDMRRYVDRLVELKLQNREKSYHQLALEYPIQPGKCISISPQVAHYLYWVANNRYRLDTVNALTDFDIRIYGSDDWQHLLKGTPLEDRFFGSIDPVHELPHLFASAKINLNIHSIQCRGSLNQRDFNAPLAGGFLLSDWVPAAGRYFKPGVEAIYWSDFKDLRRKVAYYLKNEVERDEVIKNGQIRVRRDHLYKKRVKQLLDVIGSQI